MNYNMYAFCIEDPSKIENYELAKADDFKGWDVHHRFELKCPVYKPKAKELMEWNLYFHRPASELIFLKHGEHSRLHRKYDGGSFWKRGSAISKAKLGQKYGPQSEEHKRKRSESMKGKNKGKHCYNNGVVEIRAYSCPDGFIQGRLYKRGR